MASKWSELFNVGEEFDDEDSLSLSYSPSTVPAQSPVNESPVVSVLRAPSTANLQTAKTSSNLQPRRAIPPALSPSILLQQHGRSQIPGNPDAPASPDFDLRPPPVSANSCGHPPKILSGNVANTQRQCLAPVPRLSEKTASGERLLAPVVDDFDDIDWDTAFADIEEPVSKVNGHQLTVKNSLPKMDNTGPLQPTVKQPRVEFVSPAKKLRASNCGGGHPQVNPGLQDTRMENIAPNTSWGSARQSAHGVQHCSSFSAQKFPSFNLSPSAKRPDFSTGIQTPICLNKSGSMNGDSVLARTPLACQETARNTRPMTPLQSQKVHSLPNNRMQYLPAHPSLKAGSPVPSMEGSRPASRESSFSAVSPKSLQAPVFTNHLVQLVSAASKIPQVPRLDHPQAKIRRFPGPAGLLPQQPSGRNLDEILISHRQVPTHGALAKLQAQLPSSQQSSPQEDEFYRGPWAAMKAETGLDEKNPSCFLKTYSIIMVLRKAALKQLSKNKVPYMAVVVKSITRTNNDAKAVFRDPTGEMHGTVHRQLLETRQSELKTGAVLLLKQVGVFSPSHRNHYLNVTPNNVLRIYSPDWSNWTSSELSQNELKQMHLVPEMSFRKEQDSAINMNLVYEEEEDDKSSANMASKTPSTQLNSANSNPGRTAPQTPGAVVVDDDSWDADNLDDLLGEIPEEAYCF
uniref:Homologous recombination factor with OB-fold n=1 Tax=Lepisosteus oculatus TaxID=7918 RepID=W5N2D0_LEPOC|nr:PREDICTED: uncharacterized protein C17orf53 homolog isoform X1 [Lepisosteus oculatus]